MYGALGRSAPSLHRETTDSLITTFFYRTVRKTVELPERTPLAGAMKRDYFRILQKIAECRLQVTSRNSVSLYTKSNNFNYSRDLYRLT